MSLYLQIIFYHTYKGCIRRLRLSCWKLKLFMRGFDVKHWKRWLKTLHTLTLDRTLRHLQLYIHFNSMKQSTSGCFVQWKCVKVDEVVLLQKGISVDLHQKDLLHVCILSQLTSNWLFWRYFRKVPYNDYIRMMKCLDWWSWVIYIVISYYI